MRNPNRIKPFCNRLRKYWEEECPDWRFGQMICNFIGFCRSMNQQDIFFIEDDEMKELLDKFFTQNY